MHQAYTSSIYRGFKERKEKEEFKKEKWRAERERVCVYVRERERERESGKEGARGIRRKRSNNFGKEE